MLEIGVLAASIVSSFLVPFVKEGADNLTSTLAKKTSESAANGLVSTARQLWDRVRGKADGVDAEIVKQFEDEPDKMKGHLEAVVRSLLESDPQFHQQISDLVESREEGTPRWQLMGEYVGVVDARNAHIGGDAIVAGIVIPALPRSDAPQRPQGE